VTASTRAITVAAEAGIAFRVHEYEHERGARAWGPEAAAALGVDPARVLKTLVVDASGELVVAVVPVESELELKALARAVGSKHAHMAAQAVAERATGYVVGGISPLGQKQQLPTVVDDSASGLGTVYVSAGRRGLELEIAADDLVAVTHGRYAAIARRPPASGTQGGDPVGR
jgi:Cys-tRNA(Pro)/Cys-tRNA(Cys) deacylase